MHPLLSLSPIDGRYAEETKPLSPFFSEMALMRYRVMLEIEYVIALSREPSVTEFPSLSAEATQQLRSLYKIFTFNNAKKIKALEEKTKHDIKAVEYFIREKIQAIPEAHPYESFIHFALTSEDINNLAYTLMWKHAVERVYIPTLKKLLDRLLSLAATYHHIPLLSLTHGQPATPTTVGKEYMVFILRIKRQLNLLTAQTYTGKLNGATGTWAAHVVAYPNTDWMEFSRRFVRQFGLEPLLYTTQLEPRDTLAEGYQAVGRINTILLDFSRDMWLYISRGIFKQKQSPEEIGSSTMPHKINPIQFENAEGNICLANGIAQTLAGFLPVSRMQRDLSGSTLIRNQGVLLAHSLIACQNILRGLSKIEVNVPAIQKELNDHWEVLTEAIQTILRKYGDREAYERLHELSKQTITKETLHQFIETLNIPEEERVRLKQLTPDTYIGLAGASIKQLKTT